MVAKWFMYTVAPAYVLRFSYVPEGRRKNSDSRRTRRDLVPFQGFLFYAPLQRGRVAFASLFSEYCGILSQVADNEAY